MSLKTIPGFGKSGTARMNCSSSRISIRISRRSPEHDADPGDHPRARVVRQTVHDLEAETGAAHEPGDDDHREHHDDRLVHAQQDRGTRERHLHLPERLRPFAPYASAASTISVGT